MYFYSTSYIFEIFKLKYLRNTIVEMRISEDVHLVETGYLKNVSKLFLNLFRIVPENSWQYPERNYQQNIQIRCFLGALFDRMTITIRYRLSGTCPDVTVVEMSPYLNIQDTSSIYRILYPVRVLYCYSSVSTHNTFSVSKIMLFFCRLH